LNVMSSVVDQTSTSRIRTVTRSPAPRATAAAERLAAATASNGYATTPVRGDGALVPARWRAGRLRGAAGRPAAGTRRRSTGAARVRAGGPGRADRRLGGRGSERSRPGCPPPLPGRLRLVVRVRSHLGYVEGEPRRDVGRVRVRLLRTRVRPGHARLDGAGGRVPPRPRGREPHRRRRGGHRPAAARRHPATRPRPGALRGDP